MKVAPQRDMRHPVQQAIDRWLASHGREGDAGRELAIDAHAGGDAGESARFGLSAGNTTATRRRGKSATSLALIDAARTILQEIQPASIRAVCYRLFVLKLIPSMARSTSRVSRQLTYAREQGLLPWEWVVDETREPERVQAFENPAAYVEVVKTAYRRDRWADQPHSVEVWSEKGTIRGTLAPVLHAYGITFRVMHGFASSTTVHQIAEETQRATKPLTVFYAGDWDPSGLHMSAVDLPSRLARYGGHAHLVRVALVEGDLADLPSFSAETSAPIPATGGSASNTARRVGSWTLSAPSCCATASSGRSWTYWTTRPGNALPSPNERSASRSKPCCRLGRAFRAGDRNTSDRSATRQGREGRMRGSARPARRPLTLVEAALAQAPDPAPGLSLASCRHLLRAAGADMSDAEVTRLRDQMYDIARSVCAVYPGSEARLEWSALDGLSRENREAVEERAAVLEFDAGMTRTEATRTAIASHVKPARSTTTGSER